MPLLIVQLSDIHLQSNANPVEGRLPKLLAAISSIRPLPNACLVLATGDIAYSGESEQYARAVTFFSDLKVGLLELGFKSVVLNFIPGNHDCLLPKDELELRSAMVEGARTRIQTSHPDPAFLRNLLAPQNAYFDFQRQFDGRDLSYIEKICRAQTLTLGSKTVRLISINTALLSQRDEVAGSLYVPQALIEPVLEERSDADATICVYHHPDNWFEPNFRREFRKLVEGAAHLIFTGHEHRQDDHWTEASTGEHTAYIEADPLQDRAYPKTSGFNCLVVDFERSIQVYYHFRWKGDFYQAVVDGKEHPARLSEKSLFRFEPTTKMIEFLSEDDFGFTHPRKSDLKLADLFVYPSLSVTSSQPAERTVVLGPAVPEYLFKEQCVYIYGQDRGGKTSLLKVLYTDLIATTNRVPLYLAGASLPTDAGTPLYSVIDSAVRTQYGEDAVERYRQLQIEKRVVFIDDFHKSRLKTADKQVVVGELRKFFGLVIVVSNKFPDLQDYELELYKNESTFTRMLTIKEMPPSARATLVDKWLTLGTKQEASATDQARESLKEQNLLSDLIRRRALPSLPYLILGVLQIRHTKREDIADPGSFGYLFQGLVIDALSITSNRPHIDRKEGILRRFAYSLFRRGDDGGSKQDYDAAVASYTKEIRIRVDGEAIYADLIAARVLKEVDGRVSFRHSYFFHYFVAKQLLDGIDSDSPAEARAVLEGMTDRPLASSNKVTLMFFLFFRKRDPIIDRLVQQASEIFADEEIADMVEDVKFLDKGTKALQEAVINETVDLKAEEAKRLETEDREEEQNAKTDAESQIDVDYSSALDFATKLHFANARMELLGQVIRSFSGTLDGAKKQQILEAVFRLGLRTLHAIIGTLENFASSSSVFTAEIGDKQQRADIESLIDRVLGLLARLHCLSSLLNLSRAVGVSDIEESFEDALHEVGNTCATDLLELAGVSGDIRGATGYVMAEGCVHPPGERYEALAGALDDAASPLAPVPAFVRSLRSVVERTNPAGADSPITEHRSTTLTSIAGKLRNAGLSAEALEVALIQVNADRCAPPLPTEEVRSIPSHAVAWKLPEAAPEIVWSRGAATISAGPSTPAEPLDWRTRYHTLEDLETVEPATFMWKASSIVTQ